MMTLECARAFVTNGTFYALLAYIFVIQARGILFYDLVVSRAYRGGQMYIYNALVRLSILCQWPQLEGIP